MPLLAAACRLVHGVLHCIEWDASDVRHLRCDSLSRRHGMRSSRHRRLVPAVHEVGCLIRRAVLREERQQSALLILSMKLELAHDLTQRTSQQRVERKEVSSLFVSAAFCFCRLAGLNCCCCYSCLSISFDLIHECINLRCILLGRELLESVHVIRQLLMLVLRLLSLSITVRKNATIRRILTARDSTKAVDSKRRMRLRRIGSIALCLLLLLCYSLRARFPPFRCASPAP